jgi:glucokinase
VFLAGDIGGTHSRLALYERSARGVRSVKQQDFDSRAYGSLDAVVKAFLGKAGPRVAAAAFGIAGPVVDGRCAMTNLGWVVDVRVLSRKLGVKKVSLINDLVALALGAVAVPKEKLYALGNAGLPKKKGGNIAVIAAGTGLGEAILAWDAPRSRFVPSPTEGGHTDFAPRDDLQYELHGFLRGRFGSHVSWERVLSGNGLGSLYDFFREARRVGETATNVRAIAAAADRNPVIAELGIAGKSKAAKKALDLFASMYGAEAGNLALKTLAVGGVYVCGNIAARALSVLERGDFHRSFVAKGRQSPLMESIPVAVVLDTGVGLAGALRVAMGN